MKLFVAGLMAIALAGCTGSTTTTPQALSSIGDTVTEGDRAIAVKECETMDEMRVSNQFADPIQGPILLCTIGVKNTGNQSGNVLFSSFKLQDSQGRTYDELTDTTYSLWRDDHEIKPRGSDLTPGEVRVDVVAFRVSPSAEGFTLLWNDSEISLD